MTKINEIRKVNLDEFNFPLTIVDLLGKTELCKTNGEGRRLLFQDQVRLEGEIVKENISFQQSSELLNKHLQVGKAKIVKFISKSSQLEVLEKLTEELLEMGIIAMWDELPDDINMHKVSTVIIENRLFFLLNEKGLWDFFHPEKQFFSTGFTSNSFQGEFMGKTFHLVTHFF